MMNAGTSTTTAALTNSICPLYKHPKAPRSSEKRWMLLQAQQKFQVLENLHICRTSSLALKNLSMHDLRVPSEYLALYQRAGGETLVSLLMKMLGFQVQHTLCQEI